MGELEQVKERGGGGKRPLSRRAVRSVRDHIAATVKAARMAVRLSQEGLAVRAGLSSKCISEVELGQKAMTTDTLWLIIKALRKSGSPITIDIMFPPVADIGPGTLER